MYRISVLTLRVVHNSSTKSGVTNTPRKGCAVCTRVFSVSSTKNHGYFFQAVENMTFITGNSLWIAFFSFCPAITLYASFPFSSW